MEELQVIIEKYKDGNLSLVGVLQDISDVYGYLPEEVLTKASQELDVPISLFYSLATFYKSFRLEPIGKCRICVCVGTACHVRGASKIVDALERELNIKAGETTDDGDFTLETLNCLGACAMGPLVTVDGEYNGNMEQKSALKLLITARKNIDSEKAQEIDHAVKT